MKCNRLGCDKEGFHAQIPLGDGLFADAYFCQEHYDEGISSVVNLEKDK